MKDNYIKMRDSGKINFNGHLSLLFLFTSVICLVVTAKGQSKYRNDSSYSLIYSLKNNHSFGMRLRGLPKKFSDIYSPTFVQSLPSNEATIVRIATNKLKIFYINRPEGADKMMSITSTDGGLTWNDPQKEFTLPDGGYNGNQEIKDAIGRILSVYISPGEGQGGYRGRLANLWYCHTDKDVRKWTIPREIFHGYVGALRGFIQLKSGRLLLAFAKAVPEREKKPTGGGGITDYGWNDIISLYSDDGGKTWKPSENSLKVVVQRDKATRYGGWSLLLLSWTIGRYGC